MENLSVNPENYKILVVDDIATNVLLLKTILGKAGYRIVTATGGREALEKVESESPDLILLDIMMPDMNGYEVIERLKAVERFTIRKTLSKGSRWGPAITCRSLSITRS